MPKYGWEAKTKGGAAKSGTIEASSRELAAAMLKRSGYESVTVRDAEFAGRRRYALRRPRVTSKEIVVFTRQFATMIDAGLPLVQCLDILAGQQVNPAFGACLTRVKEDVESGATFAESLGRHPQVFDRLFVNLVAAGEVGGILDRILHRLAAYIEKAQKLKKRIKGAMVYPATIMSIAVIVIAVILIFVIPTFAKMFADFGGELPGPTRLVMALSDFLVGYGAFIVAAMVSIFYAIRRFYRTAKGNRLIDALALRAPIAGNLIRKVAVAKFTRTLGTMVSSGIPIMDGLDICAKTAGNVIIEEAIYRVRQAISEGKTMAEPLGACGHFPPMVVQMIAVGEATGAMDSMLEKIADFYDDEVDDAVANMTAMMEPMLMVFLGTAVGGLVVAMYLPIFKLAGAVGG